jgi:hypothetical protein
MVPEPDSPSTLPSPLATAPWVTTPATAASRLIKIEESQLFRNIYPDITG